MSIIGQFARWIFCRMPASNYIVFESTPVLSDNAKAVYDEMVRQGYQKKYKFFWWVRGDKSNLPVLPKTAYISQETWLDQKIFNWVTMRAKCLICCNAFLTTQTQFQTSFYLTHGTALKKLHSYVLPENISYTVVASEHTKQVMAEELQGDIDTFHALGYPRNDAFYQPAVDLHGIFGEDYQKIIVWYPTFRQHKGGMRTAAENALPVLHDTETAIRLNEIAVKNKVLIVIKPHFAQDVSYIKDHGLPNIRFIDDAFLMKHQISSYEFVGSCDAMITDYSSIYFDYLLCDKPVAVIWEDIEDYRKNPGFAMDPEYYMKGAQKIYHLLDFETFIRDVSDGNDGLKKERYEINRLVNYRSDGKNSVRVVNFIKEKAQL